MTDCEYCGHPISYHRWESQRGRPECQVELGDEWASGYSYKREYEPTKEKLCGCYKVRESIKVT